MARRIVNRMDKRVEHEAWERRQDDDEREDEEEEGEGDEDEEEEDKEPAEGEEAGEGGDEEGAEDEEEAPKPKKKAKAKAPAKPKSRARAVKVTRMRVVWGVFNNSHQMVASYEYPKRGDAEAHAAKASAEKRTGHPFFIQPVKEPIEDKEKQEK